MSPAQYSPAAQGAQVGGVLPVPGAVCRVPAAHEPCGRHTPALDVVEMVPGAHGMHTWSPAALPAPATNVPGAHTVHALQLALLMPALNWPAGQVAHSRSLVGVLDPLMYCPGSQLRTAVHMVALAAVL
jgi:hypothetical protein